MSAPFRELFVELPRAVFDVLHGAYEAEVRRLAAPVVLARPSIVDVLNTSAVIRGLCDRYGWRSFRALRRALTREVDLRPVLACGHPRTIRVSEIELETSADLAGLLARVIERGLRSRACYCVQRST